MSDLSTSHMSQSGVKFCIPTAGNYKIFVRKSDSEILSLSNLVKIYMLLL